MIVQFGRLFKDLLKQTLIIRCDLTDDSPKMCSVLATMIYRYESLHEDLIIWAMRFEASP